MEKNIGMQALWMCRVGGEYNRKLKCRAVRMRDQVCMHSCQSLRLNTNLLVTKSLGLQLGPGLPHSPRTNTHLN